MSYALQSFFLKSQIMLYLLILLKMHVLTELSSIVNYTKLCFISNEEVHGQKKK